MTIVNEQYSFPRSTVFRYQKSPGSGTPPVPVDTTRVTVQAPWTEGSARDIRRVDPLGRFYHGYYLRESSSMTSLPQLIGSLVYETKLSTVKQYHTITLSGSGFGYVIPRCRWFYEDEKSKYQLINNAIGGALEQYSNLALFLAELDKTSSLFAKSANKLADAASDVRKGRFSRAARRLGIRKPSKASRGKSFADNWLEYSYGWTPVVLDAVGLMRHLMLRSRGVIVKSRSRTSSSLPLSDSRQVLQEKEASAQHRFLATWNYSGTWSRKEQVELVFRLPSNFWDQVSSLGFMDPGTLAWESIPLSFVVDWFANVGDFLGSLHLGLVLEYVTGSYVEFHRNSGTLSGTAYWADTKPGTYKYTSVSASVTPSTFEEVKLRREVILEAEVAVSLFVESPLSVNHAITASALVVQRLK